MNHAQTSSLAARLLGLFDDMRLLIVQEVRLAKDEVLEKLLGMRRGVLLLCAGLLVLFVCGMTLALMLVYLLQAAADFPLWACYALVGGTLGAAAWVLLAAGKYQIQGSSLLPSKTIETMKETTIWLEKQAESFKT